MAREYEQLKSTVATLQMFQHEGEKAITPMTGSKLIIHLFYFDEPCLVPFQSF